MLLKIVGIICIISIIAKNIIQYFLYSYSVPDDVEGNSYTPFRLSLFLPYFDPVPLKLKKVKLICNICFYISIGSAILCVLIWIFYPLWSGNVIEFWTSSKYCMQQWLWQKWGGPCNFSIVHIQASAVVRPFLFSQFRLTSNNQVLWCDTGGQT